MESCHLELQPHQQLKLTVNQYLDTRQWFHAGVKIRSMMNTLSKLHNSSCGVELLVASQGDTSGLISSVLITADAAWP